MVVTKKKKRSEEILIQQEAKDKEWIEYRDGVKKRLELEGIAYEAVKKQADRGKEELGKSKRAIIEDAGNKLIALGKVPKLELLMKELRAEFASHINRRDGVYYQVAKKHPEWTQAKFNHARNCSDITTKVKRKDIEPLTQQDKEFIQEVENEIQRDKKVLELIFYWTGKDIAEQGKLLGQTPKGENWLNRLVAESRDYMITTARRMTDHAIDWSLKDARTISHIADKFGDVVFEERERRKREKALTSV